MSIAQNTSWKQNLQRAVDRCKATVIGVPLVEYVQHGLLVQTALAAFGNDPRATFFIEGLCPHGDIPRPDLILLHPEVGVLVIENKGIELHTIKGVQNTALTLLRDGHLKVEDPFRQAEQVMYRLKDLCSRRLYIQDALFLRTGAFPRIRRAELERRFEVQFPAEALFADACSDPKEFRKQVLAYTERGQQAAQKAHRLTQRAHDGILGILSGKAIFNAPRRSYIPETDQNLLGVRIQEMELALKPPTQQQKDFGKDDLRGTHRLFRGVAGSGKSIMLVLNVAQTMLAFSEEKQGLLGATQPSPRILVVCFNKTLVHYLKGKIEDRYGRIAWGQTPEEMLTVTHFEGLVRLLIGQDTALDTGLTWEDDDRRAQALLEVFDKLTPSRREPLFFDAVYVDEAQDFSAPELELLRRLTRTGQDGRQTLILFYDNAQNIFGVTAPTWEKLGINIKGGRTIFLDQCLRNTTETLAFAFNVLVGSFAPEGQRVATRQFADVASLRQRELIKENGDRYDIHFAQRSGPPPVVQVYPHRQAEIHGVVETIQTLVTREKVLPSDILVLYKSHYSFKGSLADKIRKVIGPDYQVHVVDSDHDANKNSILMEEGFLTISTIASAKGYDAPVVFLVGVDELDTDSKGRASFYVGATRAKMCLYVSGVRENTPGLLAEIVQAGAAMAISQPMKGFDGTKFPAVRVPPIIQKPPRERTLSAQRSAAPTPQVKPTCQKCGSSSLHAQHGLYGYYFRCIECLQNTPIDEKCTCCGKRGKIRKDGYNFFRDCKNCKHSEVLHRNVPLDSL